MPGKHFTETQQSQEAIESLIINPEDARLENSEASQLLENLMQYEMVLSNHSKPQLLQTSELGALSSTCLFLFALFRDELRQRLLFQALIDATKANTIRLRRILESHPELLHKPAPAGMVITSQLTFQSLSIGDKNLLAIALRRTQVEMHEKLLPYYKKNPESAAKALEQWHVPEVSEEEFQGYKKRINQLIDVIIDDPITDFKTENPDAATEQALKAFMNELLPDNAKPIEDYPDPLQMAIAALDILIERLRFNDVKSLAQCDLFMVRVVGLLYTLLVPEDAKVVAQGLSKLDENGDIELGEKAQNLKLQSEQQFYRSGKDDSTGQGFKFFCNYAGVARRDEGRAEREAFTWIKSRQLKILLSAKHQRLESSRKSLNETANLSKTTNLNKTTPHQGV